MLTHKQRMLMAIKGAPPDRLPFAPRIDLWFNANSVTGTLPEKYKGRVQDEISRAEGWALHKVNPEYQKVRKPEDNLHWAIGVMSYKESAFHYKFSSDVDILVERTEDRTHVVYRTPVGSVSTTVLYTEEMRRSGVSNFWIEEYVIKDQKDYAVVRYLFENLELIPHFDDYTQWKHDIGEDGLAVTLGGRAASPMHHIQKYFLDATTFYYHYHDFPKEMRALAESLELYFDQALKIVADSPAEAVLWGANFDDTLTYPAFFEKEIVPWIRKASDCLGVRGKAVFCHCDGENLGLMDLIRDSGMHVAEAICPYPMTRVKIEEYYRRWSNRLTLFGGIPSILLLEESTSEEEFEAYLDHLFEAVAPGTRMILGIADSTPPHAVFERLVRIGERVEKEGLLPLKGGAVRPISERQLEKAANRAGRQQVTDEMLEGIQENLFKGNPSELKKHARDLLIRGIPAKDILEKGLLSAMEVIGEKFKSGELFIPEVLLSARAMNETLAVLEPYLASEKKEARGKVLIGTVHGDLHDIGKNLVTIMLRGVGFEVQDLGINVSTDEFVQKVAQYRPDILGLSALLTTTMQEMRKVIEALKSTGLQKDVRVMVGGAPVNQKFANDIGADAYAQNAGEAISITRRLLAEKT